LFPKLYQAVENLPLRQGITHVDILDLPQELRSLFTTITRRGSITPADAAQVLNVTVEQVTRLAAGLAEKGYLLIEAKTGHPVYKIRRRPKRNRHIRTDVWQKPDF